jgi:uncharacterized cupin superfamily protein
MPSPTPHTSPVAAETVAPESSVGYPEPFRSRMGQSNWRALGDPFGLTQFGVSLETLQPGAQSALRHWHTLSDEWLYMLQGALTLYTNDGEWQLSPGQCMGFKAGDPNGHHLVNHSDKLAQFVVVGSRVPGDMAFYPDDDLASLVTEKGRVAVHKDGTPYPKPA